MGFHFFDLIPILLIALAIFGPKALQSMARDAGKGVREANKIKEKVMAESANSSCADQPLSGRTDAHDPREERRTRVVKHPMPKRQGLLHSPTDGTYPPGLVWDTSCPIHSS